MIDIQPGDWYYGVLCKLCNNPILIAHDLSFGVKTFPADTPKILLRCQREECAADVEYEARKVQSFRAPYR